ncbi:Beta-glucuronidase, partial [Tolypocladium ophioglossoides CBS 100239]
MLYRGGLLALIGAAAPVAARTYKVPSKPSTSGEPLDGFVSYSIEFSSFPDFAGTCSPNTFSYNLLNNLGGLGGTKPYIRVGGNTQDYALYNASQQPALIGSVDPRRSPDYPTTVHIGKAYFESYRTWPGVKFSHGLNMGLGGTRPAGWQTLVDTVPLACEALGGQLYAWEYGNEPDLFSTSAQGPVRPPAWNESAYVWQWRNATAEIRRRADRLCPEMRRPRFMAPSFAGVGSRFHARTAWEAGLDGDNDVEFFSTHNYISGANSPGVTLQGTLMNHAMTTKSVDAHTQEYASIFAGAPKSAPPLIFGETNSLYSQGKPGLSNSFGAALWGVDFNLYAASAGVRRVHMHQGTNYRYQAWQPVSTDKDSVGTKAPYYGSIAVAAMVAPSNKQPVRISSIPLSSDEREAAYAAHASSGQLARITVVNMHAYNTTVDGAGLEPLPRPDARRSRPYAFAVEGVADGQTVLVQRLLANGSDAITGITYDGWSYNWDLDR